MDIILSHTVGLLIIAILIAIIVRRIHLPYTVGLVVAGIGITLSHIEAGVVLTHDIIFDVILPPLLFEAALNIHWSELRRDALPVLTLAILGVVISAIVVAGGIASVLGWPLPSALVFGVLIAATDPVAVIAMLPALRAGCAFWSKAKASLTTVLRRCCSRSFSAGRRRQARRQRRCRLRWRWSSLQAAAS